MANEGARRCEARGGAAARVCGARRGAGARSGRGGRGSAAEAARAAAEAGRALQALDAELREATRMEVVNDYANWHPDGLGGVFVALAARIASS